MKRFFSYLFAFILVSTGAFTLGLEAYHGAVKLSDYVSESVGDVFTKYVPIEIREYIPVFAEPSREEIVPLIAKKYSLPPILIDAIIEVESNGTNASRFEHHLYARDKDKQNELERIMRNTSHGWMQVMGFNAAICGLKWQDLYNPLKGVDCGAKILRNCFDRAKGNTQSEKLTSALGCYNGDRVTYPQKVKARIADHYLNLAPEPMVVARNEPQDWK